MPVDVQDNAPVPATTTPGTELEPAVVEPELLDQDKAELLDQDDDQGDGLLSRQTGRGGVEPVRVLHERLAGRRAVVETERQDELARRVATAEHQMALDAVADQVARRRRERQEQAKNDTEAARLAALYRHTASAGERARIAAQITRTAEMRALRVATVQRVSLWAGLVLLLGFGAWSTAGVHDGLTKLMDLRSWSPGWVAGWALEPLLITIVAGLIVIRALLRISGGDVDYRATVAEMATLGVSIGLNMLGGWETTASPVAALGEALAHSVGAIFAALTAWLMGVIIDWTTTADPWADAPRVADLNLDPATAYTGAAGPVYAKASGRSAPTAIRRAKHTPVLVDRSALPEEARTLLDTVRAAITAGRLPVDPSAYAIYKHVMNNKGDRARSTQIADLVAGWRAPLHAVADVTATG